MLDPQLTFGRFTDLLSESQPRDVYEWLSDAEDTPREACLCLCVLARKLLSSDERQADGVSGKLGFGQTRSYVRQVM